MNSVPVGDPSVDPALRLPNTRRLVHAYGLADDAPAHLMALSGTDADAIAKAGSYLTSAIIHQGTPWPATGPVVGYVCSLVSAGQLSPAARPLVREFLDEVLAAVELAQRVGGAEYLREQIAANPFDLDAAIHEMAQLSEDEAEAAYEAIFEEDALADLIMHTAFLGILERADAISEAQAKLATLE
jgi:hypothetical protein